VINEQLSGDIDLEIDPIKVSSPYVLSMHQQQLTTVVKQVGISENLQYIYIFFQSKLLTRCGIVWQKVILTFPSNFNAASIRFVSF